MTSREVTTAVIKTGAAGLQALQAESVPKLTAIKEKRIPYVFFSDHSIPRSVNLETYRYALELYQKYGRY